jgi:hypothetical protein
MAYLRILIFQTMKKLLAALLFPALLIGCDSSERERLEAEVQRLQGESSQKDADIDGLISSLTNIQDNLDSIKTLEGIVTAKTIGEGGYKSAEEDILDDMRSIYDKMRKNREQIGALEKQLKNSSIGSEKLQQLITKLKADLAEKDTEIAVLRDKLAKADIHIDALMADIDQLALEGERKDEVLRDKEMVISSKEQKLQTAYWIKGTKKELMDRNIIDRQGAFLGMGGTRKVADDVPHGDLQLINIYDDTEFTIGAKKADIVSSHPSGSYEVIGDRSAERLVVKDPDAFWRNSKVLVIVVN